MNIDTRLSGDELRLIRLAGRVTATSVARHWGVHRTRITNLEHEARPPRTATARYLAALAAALAER